MSKHPVNLAIRFVLEVAAIISFAVWGLKLLDTWVSIVLAVVLPVVFAMLWGVFAVPNDPSRSGKTVIPTPGPVRLILELALFGAASWMLFDLAYLKAGGIFSALVLIHYASSYDRIIWLLKQK